MEKEFRNQIRQIYRVNRILYLAIFLGMSTLTLVAVIFHLSDVLTPQELIDSYSVDRVLLMIVVVLLFLVLYIKRTYLVPEKLVARAEKRPLNIVSSDVADFVQQFGQEADILVKALIIMRRYFMVIWSIANLVILLAFIGYVLTANLRIFLIYALVSFYSLAINYPAFRLVERCYYLVKDKNGE